MTKSYDMRVTEALVTLNSLYGKGRVSGWDWTGTTTGTCRRNGRLALGAATAPLEAFHFTVATVRGRKFVQGLGGRVEVEAGK